MKKSNKGNHKMFYIRWIAAPGHMAHGHNFPTYAEAETIRLTMKNPDQLKTIEVHWVSE
jgi:hypothetical protein